MTALHAGGGTDPGQIRTQNQDAYLIEPDVNLFVVADGMGGHAAGDVAARMAIDVMGDMLDGQPRTLAEVTDAVHEAHARVLAAADERSDLDGMGTTCVAAALINADGEDRIALVNVGDSRAYLLKAQELEQITEDHSLVQRMVNDGVIQPHEAETHPQRNVVTRAIGVGDEIEVDSFELLPFAGDRYLLCSDGLSGEVSAHDIAEVLRNVVDPAEAAQELIDRANAAGGRDNITAVVIDVVDDGGRAIEASQVVAAGGRGTAETAPLPDADLDEPGKSDRAEAERLVEPEADAPDPPTPPRLSWRSVVFVMAVLLVLAVGAGALGIYARGTYYVAPTHSGQAAQLVIYQGRSGGFLWFEPTVAERTSLRLRDLPDAERDEVADGKEFGSLSAARDYLTRISEPDE